MTLVWAKKECKDDEVSLIYKPPPAEERLLHVSCRNKNGQTEEVKFALSGNVVEPIQSSRRRGQLHIDFQKREAKAWQTLVERPTPGVRIERDWNRGMTEEEMEEEDGAGTVEISSAGIQTVGKDGKLEKHENYKEAVEALPAEKQEKELLILNAYKEVRAHACAHMCRRYVTWSMRTGTGARGSST